MRMHVPLDSLTSWKEYLGNSAQWECSKELRYMAQLGLVGQSIVHVKYQFLYRTALALLEAERVGAKQATVWFHCSEEGSLQEYRKFVALYGVEGEADTLCGPVKVRGVELFFAWVFFRDCQE